MVNKHLRYIDQQLYNFAKTNLVALCIKTHLDNVKSIFTSFCVAMDNKAIRRVAFFVLIACLFLENCRSFGADDTISGSQSLSGDHTIVSAGGVFELGFFTPGNSSNYYLGIWYKGVKQTLVWVANREKPFSDRFSSELRISFGNLVLFNESKVPIWSTNANPTSSSLVQAVLLDNGNLVLKDGTDSSSEPSWQSFDYPTDTWLPEGKLGYNKRTKERYFLSSWKNPDDPAPGLFSFEPVINDTSYVVWWNKSESFWSTGVWDESSHIFSRIPEMRANHYYNFTYVSNRNETYFTYTVYNHEFSRFVMDTTGQVKQLILDTKKEWNLYWTQPRQQCQVYAFCGTYGSCNENSSPFCTCLRGFEPKLRSDWDSKNFLGGCVRRTKLQCGNSSVERDRFMELPSVTFLESYQSVQVENTTVCESACLNNCSCVAYSYHDNGCSIWTEDLLNLQQLALGDNRGITLYIRLAASEFRAKHKGLVTGVVAGSVAGSIAFLCLVLFLAKRRANKRVGAGKAMQGSLMAFSYRDMQSATKNFSEKLGGGGFGSVFKGTLPDSTMVAVKKLESAGQGEKEFRAEVATIGAIQHVNLVRLRGFCSQGAKKLLVYDYMPNGSLASHLFGESKSNVLAWNTRYHIALGTARGLVYLHNECRDCIIHCDIKPENILLDEEFCPKVADFGLAKLVGRDFSRVLTTMRGTIGYLAPEWIAGVAITPKADVYSYGMTLFEIVSGRRNSESSESETRMKYFPSLAAKAIVEGDGDVTGLLDPRLEGNADIEEVERVCKVACWCIQDDESHRPSMGEVVQILEGILEVNLPPIPRSLYFFDIN